MALGKWDVTPDRISQLALAAALDVPSSRGETRECTDALRRAEAALDRAPSNDDPSWVRYFDESAWRAKGRATIVRSRARRTQSPEHYRRSAAAAGAFRAGDGVAEFVDQAGTA